MTMSPQALSLSASLDDLVKKDQFTKLARSFLDTYGEQYLMLSYDRLTSNGIKGDQKGYVVDTVKPAFRDHFHVDVDEALEKVRV